MMGAEGDQCEETMQWIATFSPLKLGNLPHLAVNDPPFDHGPQWG
jgi:hypothetical protein